MKLLVLLCLHTFFQVAPVTNPLPDSSPFRDQFVTAVQEGDSIGMVRAWFRQGVALDEAGDYPASRRALEQALKLCKPLDQKAIEAKIRNYLASVLGEVGERDAAIVMYDSAYQCYMSAGDSALAANVLINIGIDYVNFGRYEDALNTELRALELRLLSRDSGNIATYYQHIGEVYKQLGMKDQWKEYLEIARDLSRHPNYATMQTRIGILNDLGGVFEQEGSYADAIKTYDEMYQLSQADEYLNGMATARNNLASVYLALDSTDQALVATREALVLQEQRGSNYGILCARNQLGEIFLRQMKNPQATDEFKKALELAIGGSYVYEQIISVKGLYASAKAQGRYKDALRYHEQYLNLGDSLHGIEIQEKIADLKTRYETEKKEQQILLLSQESELKSKELRLRETIIAAGSALFLALIALLVFWMRHRRIRFRHRQNQLEQKLLRSQMNPHFIFNSLGAIQHFMIQNEGKKAAFYLGNFSQLMRSILKNSREELITLNEEIQTLGNYLQLQQMRMGDQLVYSISCDESIDPETVLLPPMLVQPFVENALKHGLKDLNHPGNVQVAFARVNNNLEIKVTDNGSGFGRNQPEEGADHVSYALDIFKERISIIKKMYNKDVVYRIEPFDPANTINPGTRVIVILPLSTEA